MSQTPTHYNDNPVSGTKYTASIQWGCIPNASTTVTVTCKAYSGTGGTGSLVQVTTLSCWLHNYTTNTDVASNSGNFNTVTCSYSSPNGSDWYTLSVEFSGVQSVGSLVAYITYTGQAFVPSISSVSPGNGGAGTAVTITGSHFTSASGPVALNGTNASSFTIVSDTQITTTVPSGATTGYWTVSNASGTATSPSQFYVANAYTYRSGSWVASPVELSRSGVLTNAQGVYVYRSGSWVSAQ